MFVTYKFRIKDKSTKKTLQRKAIACNQVWNFCVNTQREASRKYKSGLNVKWLSHFDLNNLCSGVGQEIGIHSDTISLICKQAASSRKKASKPLKYRASFGSQKSLGWIPFTERTLGKSPNFGEIIYLKNKYRFWQSRKIEGVIKTGAFVEDARGRWYVTFVCEVEEKPLLSDGQIGIDLGLKTIATCSNGYEVKNPRITSKYAIQLAKAQRARNKKRVRAIHAKIKNSRSHHLHVESTKIVNENSYIVVGDVSASKLMKTRMAKSVGDACWYSFKKMLSYKSARRQGVFLEVNERYSSQTCSSCGCIPDSSPKGIGALGIRHWTCSECFTSHDRDVNAALNILRVGLERQPPVGEISGTLDRR